MELLEIKKIKARVANKLFYEVYFDRFYIEKGETDELLKENNDGKKESVKI